MIHEREFIFIRTDTKRQKTAIDFTMVSEDIMIKTKCNVLDHHMGATNHRTFITNIQLQNRQRIYINKKQLMIDINQLIPERNRNLNTVIRAILIKIRKNSHKQLKQPKIW